MENAVKAMYMAAGVIIAVLVLGVFVYMFRTGARFGESYEAQKSTENITAFNSKFEALVAVTDQENSAADGYFFKNKGALPSDVISCANLVYSINKKNEYDNKNSVEMIVVIGSDKYYVEPYAVQPSNAFIKNKNRTTVSTMSSVNEADTLPFYEFLKKYNNVRIVNIHKNNSTGPLISANETIYEYYFDIDKDENGNDHSINALHYSDVTGKIDRIVFTAVKSKNFDNTASDDCWVEQ